MEGIVSVDRTFVCANPRVSLETHVISSTTDAHKFEHDNPRTHHRGSAERALGFELASMAMLFVCTVRLNEHLCLRNRMADGSFLKFVIQYRHRPLSDWSECISDFYWMLLLELSKLACVRQPFL